VQAMHDALEALNIIMKTARDGLEPEVPLEERAAFVKQTFRAALRADASTSKEFKAEYQEAREELKQGDKGVPDAGVDEEEQDDSSSKKTLQ
jgi:predicted kinase